MNHTLITVAAICLALTPAAHADALFVDQTFADSDWTTTKVTDTTASGTASGTSGQLVVDGNAAPSRQTTHQWVTAPGGVAITFAHVNQTFVYNPTSSPIESLDVSFDVRLPFDVLHVNTIAFGALLTQDGKFYAGPGIAPPESQVAWTPFAAPLLTASHFTEIGGSAHPDFSSSGQPITFGYYTANGGSGVTLSITAIGQVDNYRVNIVPEPTAIALLGIGTLAIARRRQPAAIASRVG